MLHFTSKLKDLTIDATDGEMGKIKDIYFDDETWKIRYMVVDTRKWLPERKVLLPPSAFIGKNEENGTIGVDYDKSTIKNSPPVPEDANLTKDKENQLINYFGWKWPGEVLVSGEQRPLGRFQGNEEKPDEFPTTHSNDEQLLRNHRDNNLRSDEEIIGARIHGKDGKLGKLLDFVYNEDWNIKYVVVTSNEWTVKDHYVYPVEQITSIDWFEFDVYLNETVNDFEEKDDFPNKDDILDQFFGKEA